MATVREGNPYQGGGMGAGGKFRKRPFRRNQTTPYDHPPSALRNPSANRNYGWFSKPVDPAQTLITTGAHMLFSSVFRKRLPAPPPSISTSPPNPLLSEAEQEVRENEQEAAAIVSMHAFDMFQRHLLILVHNHSVGSPALPIIIDTKLDNSESKNNPLRELKLL
ncbi:hypothetical protein QN277_000902 [Acacia crassicarpa]|uniref:Uncharacterized protein n=1 Tax=Acacia crassicarpa TaxID=499986 RepID=A0AAE1TG54_9FABA|nr:hypothetical protein QN277_000902 [Acacia crassicarpa]